MNETGNTINNSERQRCEVWSRVMGYHRPVAQWNIGKKSEWKERLFFREATQCILRQAA